jgi:predicted component of type VI protein secretion system
MLTLTVYRGDRIVQELDLDGPEIGIGRNADNAVVLPDDGRGVSRAHAVLRVENGSYVLYDRDSQNGTFLDGKRIKRAVVQPGQDIVIGPYRLVLMSVEAADADPGPTGTVIASRTTPPRALPASAREATPPVIAPAPMQSTPAKGSRTAVLPAGAGEPSAQPWMSRQPPSLLYVVCGVAVAVLAAVLIWQFWPATTRESPLATLATTTMTTSVTTTVPAPPSDPHAERIAEAESGMAIAEQAFASKRYATAATEFDRVAASLAPGLMADPQPPQAAELRDRALARANEARQLAALAKVPPPVLKPVDPNAVAPRQDESERDYDRRNKEAQQDYAHARRLLTDRDYIGAITIFEGLAKREPGWLDVSSFLNKARDDLAQSRQSALDEGVRRENSGYNALNERRFADAASELMAASKEFERAGALQDPRAAKLTNENLARRRQLAKMALDIARTHANNNQDNEAIKLFQLVIDVLPPGDQFRLLAEADLKKIGPGAGVDHVGDAAAPSK